MLTFAIPFAPDVARCARCVVRRITRRTEYAVPPDAGPGIPTLRHSGIPLECGNAHSLKIFVLSTRTRRQVTPRPCALCARPHAAHDCSTSRPPRPRPPRTPRTAPAPSLAPGDRVGNPARAQRPSGLTAGSRWPWATPALGPRCSGRGRGGRPPDAPLSRSGATSWSGPAISRRRASSSGVVSGGGRRKAARRHGSGGETGATQGRGREAAVRPSSDGGRVGHGPASHDRPVVPTPGDRGQRGEARRTIPRPRRSSLSPAGPFRCAGRR